MKLQMTKAGRIALTIVNTALIVLLLCGIVLLGIGSLSVGKTGTFNLFGYSYHLNKSDTLSPAIMRNDLVVVKHLPVTEFSEGNLIAFYQENENGGSDLLIRRLAEINGNELAIMDEAGETAILSADSTRFLGVATSKSTRLGKMVLFLQSDSGRSMFLWWAVGIFAFLIGVIILVHILLKSGRVPDQGEKLSVDVPPSRESASQDIRRERHVDWSAFAVKTEPEEEEAKTILLEVDKILVDLEKEKQDK